MTLPSPAVPPPGTIVLAAYAPREDLFRAQLLSIQAQTYSRWNCVVTADGDVDTVAALVRTVVGDDDRFTVIGGERLGFVKNFERGLAHVPPTSTWVALSDQDDVWYPEKLRLLVPELDTATVVSGSARLVQHPSNTVLGTTDRRNTDAAGLILNNQFTGSLMVFRAGLLQTALPIPTAPTRAAAHDHWIAVVGAHSGAVRVLDTVVQDYIQHDANVFGDPAQAPSGGLRASLATAREMAAKYQGGTDLRSVARATFDAYVGWRQVMTDELTARLRPSSALTRSQRAFGSRRRLLPLAGIMAGALRRGEVPIGFAVSYLSSWFCGVVVNGRSDSRST